MPQLSTRQEQILDFLRVYQAHRNYMPSVREIQVACSISSTSVVDYNLRLLERAGHIRRWPDISRAIELVDEERPKLEDAATVPALGAYAAKDRGRGRRFPPEPTSRNAEGPCALRVKDFPKTDALGAEGDIVVSARTARTSMTSTPPSSENRTSHATLEE